MDSEEQIANIFWADAKMISDYAHFGDVVSFDTTFGTNNESRPFGVFVGFNHFRETVVFGAALMYDETFDSFKWLFETFLKAHNGKHPKTIYTDQDIAMGKAIEEVFPVAWHGLCTFHISQNAAKHLSQGNNGESSILSDFSACMYEYEDVTKIEYEFNIMREKHFERVVQGKRNTELASEFDSRKKLPRIKMRTPMLLQASKVYTPIIFEAFQGEYERSMAACTKAWDGDNEFLVSIGSFEGDLTFEEYRVVGDPSEQTSICSCGQFNRIGILCGHALKVLDLMNIKSLPAQYILKRWTREARSGIVTDSKGINIIENPMMEASLRYKFLSHRFLTLAQQAASYPKCTLLVNNTLDILSKQIEEHLSGCASTSDQSATHKEVMSPNNLLSNARLNKKEEQKTRQNALHVGAATQVAEDSFAMDKEEPGEYMHLNSFTQLLTGQINDDLLVDDAF
ncbi:protein FAR-RED IMPAIRED RESPONSE 1-like [Oryza glaberrima]|uniref:protein FAR-RED IMPAIRED RESPONSE 1-like n=1 Tax=Oryza glaberrima TaxID=4538 RepID=UPI00224C277B|nr:protein FAR-RED IMPAIRED RESPONSE 1-like [Oryza glaberrima]